MKQKKSGLSLWRLAKENMPFLTVLAVTFLALALLVGLTFYSNYQLLRKDVVMIGNMTVTQEARRIEDALFPGANTLLVSSYAVDSLLMEGANPKEIEAYIVQETNGIITGINPDFSGIYGVIDGVYVDGIGWQPEAGYNPYTRPWYLGAAEKHGELAIVSPYVDAQTNSILVSFSKVLCDGKSVISLDIELDNIYQVTEAIQLNGKGYCFLVDNNGHIIAHRNQEFLEKNYLTDPEFADSDMRPLIRQIVSNEGDQAFDSINIDGEECMVFSNKVRGEWSVVLVVKSADLFEGVRQSLMRSILVSLGIFILVGYFCTSNYINKKKALLYADEVRTDCLTGLNNRGELDRYLNVAMINNCPDKKLYLILFDADDFKSINDRYGHQEGDRALRLMAKALKALCHGTDWFCARYGGDEFVIICCSDDFEKVRSIAGAMDEKLKAISEQEKLPYKLSLSCGYANLGPEIQTISDLIASADQMLYRVKTERKHGRDEHSEEN